MPRLVALAALLALAPSVRAQDAPAPPVAGFYLAQLTCDAPDVGRAVELFQTRLAPALDRTLASGPATSYGLLATSVGGPESLTFYLQAPDSATALAEFNRTRTLFEPGEAAAYGELLTLCPEVRTSTAVLVGAGTD